MEPLKIVSQIGQNYIFSFFLIFLKIEIPLISLGRIKHITNVVNSFVWRVKKHDSICCIFCFRYAHNQEYSSSFISTSMHMRTSTFNSPHHQNRSATFGLDRCQYMLFITCFIYLCYLLALFDL